MTDSVLIERFLNGDISAFNTLIWRWENPLYNFILRIMGESEIAKDICQTVFIKMYKELKKLRDHNRFSPWVYRIALNLCRDELKRRKNKYSIPIDILQDHDNGSHQKGIQLPDHDSKTPEEIVNNQQIGDILKRALMNIPEEQRVIIVMKQYQGLKFTEIADILHEPINTVKSRLYYGLRALKKILEESNLNKEVLLYEM